MLISLLQGEFYKEELNALRSQNSVKDLSSLAKLDPFLEGDVIHVGGHMKHSSFPYSLKHPIILPNNNTVINLLIKNAHVHLGHAGRDHVLSSLR